MKLNRTLAERRRAVLSLVGLLVLNVTCGRAPTVRTGVAQSPTERPNVSVSAESIDDA